MTRFNRLVVQWPKLTVLIALLITAFLGCDAAAFPPRFCSRKALRPERP